MEAENYFLREKIDENKTELSEMRKVNTSLLSKLNAHISMLGEHGSSTPRGDFSTRINEIVSELDEARANWDTNAEERDQLQ